MADEKMDVDAVTKGLSSAVGLQYRSVLGFTVAAAGIAGLEYRGLAQDLWHFAQAEHTELQVLVEKLTALGGEPPQVAPCSIWKADPVALIEQLMHYEAEAIGALHAIIPATGQEGRSEALEHLLEHAIMRKQRQVDLISRSVGHPA